MNGSPIIARLVLILCIRGSGSSSVNQSQLNAVNSSEPMGYDCQTGAYNRLVNIVLEKRQCNSISKINRKVLESTQT
jgi:hypothetical protein